MMFRNNKTVWRKPDQPGQSLSPRQQLRVTAESANEQLLARAGRPAAGGRPAPAIWSLLIMTNSRNCCARVACQTWASPGSHSLTDWSDSDRLRVGGRVSAGGSGLRSVGQWVYSQHPAMTFHARGVWAGISPSEGESRGHLASKVIRGSRKHYQLCHWTPCPNPLLTC
jgi:hypothetical protein